MACKTSGRMWARTAVDLCNVQKCDVDIDSSHVTQLHQVAYFPLRVPRNVIPIALIAQTKVSMYVYISYVCLWVVVVSGIHSSRSNVLQRPHSHPRAVTQRPDSPSPRGDPGRSALRHPVPTSPNCTGRRNRLIQFVFLKYILSTYILANMQIFFNSFKHIFLKLNWDHFAYCCRYRLLLRARTLRSL